MTNRKISADLKQRALALTAVNWDIKRIAFALGVSESSIQRWVKQEKHTGHLKESSPLRGRPRLLHGEALQYVFDILCAHPSMYLDEITSRLEENFDLSISVSALHRTLDALGYSRKKLRKIPAQRDEFTREQWKAWVFANFIGEQLVFADESSKDDRTSLRNYGRAMAGQRACEVVSFKHGVRYSILPALSINGFLTVRLVRGSVDGLEFYDWVVNDLLPRMNPYPGPNSVLIIDNCKTHKHPFIRQAVEAVGSLLIFLPPYSPDLNPIEEAFSCIKYRLRRERFQASEYDVPEIKLMEECMAAVTAEKARGWYAHSGYCILY